MSALLYAYALLSVTRHHAPITINVNAADGDTISGQKSFRVTVISDNPVTQVEFYVGTDLRDNATATPYIFKLDTLGETDGKLKVRFKAYTTEGETAQKSLNLIVDNQTSKGAAFHVAAGLSDLSNSNWTDAESEGRIALKIDNMSNPARLVLARAYLGMHAYDKAQKYAEDAVSQDGKDIAALNILATVNIQRAFNTIARTDSDPKEVLEEQRQALKSAVQMRAQALDVQISTFPTPTEKTLPAYVDLAMEAGRYSLAAQALMPAIDAGATGPEIIDRLAYIRMRQYRFQDALDTLDRAKKAGTMDAQGHAIAAVCFAELNDVSSSDAEMQTAESLQSDNATVRTAKAYIALKFVKSAFQDKPSFALNYEDNDKKTVAARAKARADLQNILAPLEADLGHRPETNYFVQALDNKLDQFEPARRAFQTTILYEPANPDSYIEEANRSLALSFQGKPTLDEKRSDYESAETMLQTALIAAPSSAAVLTGLAVLEAARGNGDESIKWGEAAIAADSSYTAGYVALSAAYNLAATARRKRSDALHAKSSDPSLSADERASNDAAVRAADEQATHYDELAKTVSDKAAALDPRIQGFDTSTPISAWRYYYAGGRSPIIAPPR